MKQLLTLVILLAASLVYCQDVNIPDPNFLQALIDEGVDNNDDGIIQISEAEAITKLFISNKGISNLEGIQSFANLIELKCGSNELTSLDLSENLKVEILYCSLNKLSSIDMSDNTLLKKLTCTANDLTNIDVSNNTLLRELNCSVNELTSIDVSNNPMLEIFRFYNNQLVSIDVSNNLLLKDFNGSQNAFTSIDVSNNLQLEIFECSTNNLTNIDVSKNTLLKTFYCSDNRFTDLDVSNNLLIERFRFAINSVNNIDLSNNKLLLELACYRNDIATLDLSQNLLLENLECNTNNLTSLDVSDKPSLKYLGFGSNDLTTMDLSNNPLLEYLNVGSNRLTSLDVTNNPQLEELWCTNTELTQLDLSKNINLELLASQKTLISILDLSMSPKLKELTSYEGVLEFLNISNGTSIERIDVYDNAKLLTICLDIEELDFVSGETSTSDVSLVTDCSLAFGGETHQIFGNIFYNNDSDCDLNSSSINDIFFNVDNGINSIYKPTYDLTGYNMRLPEGSYSISIIAENSELFNVDPEILQVSLDDQNSPQNHDFCISPKGTEIVDAKISIMPVDLARPGFEVSYKVLYENQGNITSTGSLELEYPADVASYVSSSEVLTDEQGRLSLQYLDLKPFEKREFILSMKLNSPMDNPPLTDGTLLYAADIIPTESEYYSSDNHFELRQEVVNSFDPNDKTCLQGTTLLDDMIGNYVDYLIRFENTGTASAVNISIFDEIDGNTFDISTIRVTDSSHPVYLQTEYDLAKFIFQNINLDFESDNTGYVSYKIKTWDNLSVGDKLINSADIYFDFNFPILTNVFETTIVTDMDNDGYHNLEDCDDNNASIYPGAEEIVGNGIDEDCDNEDPFSTFELSNSTIHIYPNPAIDRINIDIEGILDIQAKLYDIEGKLMISTLNAEVLNIESLDRGTYLLEVQDIQAGQKIVERIVINR